SANAEFVAADLLSQAEHGTDSQAVLVCTDKEKTAEILEETTKQLAKLPRREIAEAALKNSFALITKTIEEALGFSNKYAPEHLILNTKNAKEYLAQIENAGSVFIGAYSCESAGDYASGTNHTLPTYGYARSYSGVSADSFIKKITFQELNEDGIRNLGPVVEKMAEVEQLQAHKNAMTVRTKSLTQMK
ncbi:histidinol dehydrogenase, partial [Candidatus Peregrinibacteria bacterium]|nr:histidinol dehydrogenase [Candidatus Peregrinibacteria bacterium]